MSEFHQRDLKATHPAKRGTHWLQTGADSGADCWNTIGVNGDHTCRELNRNVHCHNCEVYATAAARFLDRPMPAEYQREWTDHFSHEKQITIPAKTSTILFRIGSEWLALPTQTFQEIAERRVMHRLPHRRRGVVLGIVNVRGELLICASLGRLLGLEGTVALPRGRAAFDRLLVTQWSGQRFAFPVDEVHGVHRFHSADLREPPTTVSRSGLSCASGVFPWRHHTVGYLEPELLFAALNRNLS